MHDVDVPFLSQAAWGLRRDQMRNPAEPAAKIAATVQSMLVPRSRPQAATSAATAVPPSRGRASGIAQHAAQAPATPKAANKGFFIVNSSMRYIPRPRI